MSPNNKIQAAVIGAGPAGIFAAQSLASQGYRVALFNHDIKPGGLVEYGIFLEKHKIKNGFRSQFQQILAHENIHYFGNVTVGRNGRFTIQDLFDWGFEAILVTCGAQGTKYINLPGEKVEGVYHAKDLVYHYNQLPPYSEQSFKIGRKVAIVGAGNVMTDIAHYLISYRDVDEITVIVRRGPAEVKFDQKELLPIIGYLDLADFEKELQRVERTMSAIGQDVEAAKHKILVALEKACPVEHNTKLRIHFLMSPRAMSADDSGKVSGIRVEHNTLELSEGNIVARGLGEFSDLAVDTVIFAIGDKVNDDLDLPMEKGEICKARQPKYPIEDNTYEVGDPNTGAPLHGVFYAGWSRKPSTGLAGVARRDGVFAATAVGIFLSEKPSLNGCELAVLESHLKNLGVNFVNKEDLAVLQTAEQKQAELLGLDYYKFSTNSEMLSVMKFSEDH